MSAADGLLDTIKWLHPEYAPMIDFVVEHRVQLIALAPVIRAGITEGPGALAAAEKAAPELTEAIKHFISVSPVAAVTPAITKIQAENIMRRVVGSPIMTDSEQTEFMNRNTFG